ncbi:MAG: phosphonate ABC transporter ATP-binding protein [Phycisphaeraceae bacterium]|nr:phosphonate ABC transporter ATP-binding protein [Phycisphaeraceae bacterium]
MLKINNVSVTFGKGEDRVEAVSGVSLSVAPGEFCVLLGHSGAGKSTLLKLINGQLAPDTGSVEVGGTLLSKRTRPAIQHTIGMVHQRFDLVTRLSVLDNVVLGRLPWVPWHRALLRRWDRSDRVEACRWLERVGLEPSQAKRQAGKLSGGQQQRVAIARAFVRDPKLVLADEPVASLDPVTGRAVLELLREASRERGAAVLCSLHQPDFAREFGDRIVSMTGGKIEYDGPPEAWSPNHQGVAVKPKPRAAEPVGVEHE